jgi:hypothetical protein
MSTTDEEVFRSLFAQRSTRQRDELSRCPFCGTRAIEQAVPYGDGMLWRILCGNPFCDLDCATKPARSLGYVESVWQERNGGS